MESHHRYRRRADPTLVRAHYEYRTPLSFAVRENHIPIAGLLLDHGAEPLALGNVLEMARDRGDAEMTLHLECKLASRAPHPKVSPSLARFAPGISPGYGASWPMP